jgi:hypothetical protein
MSQKKQSQESLLNRKIVEWIDKLSTHFASPQDEEQINIFLHALRMCTIYQVEQAFTRCLNECTFMPRLADVHQRMPEQRYPPSNPGLFTQSRPILEELRPLAREVCKEVTGRDYDTLDGRDDERLIHDIFAEAQRRRLREMRTA